LGADGQRRKHVARAYKLALTIVAYTPFRAHSTFLFVLTDFGNAIQDARKVFNGDTHDIGSREFSCTFMIFDLCETGNQHLYL